MSDTLLLTERPAYELGQHHYRDGISDFYRRGLFGDERRAYMLGRWHAAQEKQRTQWDWVRPLFERNS